MSSTNKLVQQWFRFARVDLNMAKALFERNDPEFFRGVGFNAQQCAEKTLKGYLTYKKIPFEKTHDVKMLSEEILKFYPELESLLKESTKLTKFAVLHRYPDANIPEPTKTDCEFAINKNPFYIEL